MIEGLAGFKVHYGQSSTRLDRRLVLHDSSQTSVTLNNLGMGTWYFAVSAFTTSGVESRLSNVVSKRI